MLTVERNDRNGRDTSSELSGRIDFQWFKLDTRHPQTRKIQTPAAGYRHDKFYWINKNRVIVLRIPRETVMTATIMTIDLIFQSLSPSSIVSAVSSPWHSDERSVLRETRHFLHKATRVFACNCRSNVSVRQPSIVCTRTVFEISDRVSRAYALVRVVFHDRRRAMPRCGFLIRDLIPISSAARLDAIGQLSVRNAYSGE